MDLVRCRGFVLPVLCFSCYIRVPAGYTTPEHVTWRFPTWRAVSCIQAAGLGTPSMNLKQTKNVNIKRNVLNSASHLQPRPSDQSESGCEQNCGATVLYCHLTDFFSCFHVPWYAKSLSVFFFDHVIVFYFKTSLCITLQAIVLNSCLFFSFFFFSSP